ncbi:Adenosylhomocysteinase [Carpediemonas membranifera]|uniref:Adenosylhomocysteinase n=1 Tax=Carpediemonas membranifera TaxID=201153 RepID=A0A8J6E160_9EUKA|nr:Adenosylhomocysteinase [Carpediemonas membranifera]|eukprot:KAG9390217.1 Adenosylhomocysteinase [Carpediemonas membranifera]
MSDIGHEASIPIPQNTVYSPKVGSRLREAQLVMDDADVISSSPPTPTSTMIEKRKRGPASKLMHTGRMGIKSVVAKSTKTLYSPMAHNGARPPEETGDYRISEKRALLASVPHLVTRYHGYLANLRAHGGAPARITLLTEVSPASAVLAEVLLDLGAEHVAICPPPTGKFDEEVGMALNTAAEGVHAFPAPLQVSADLADTMMREAVIGGIDGSPAHAVVVDSIEAMATMGRINRVRGNKAIPVICTDPAARHSADISRFDLPHAVMDLSSSTVFASFVYPHTADAVLSVVKTARSDFAFGGAHVHIVGFGPAGKLAATTLRSAGSIVTVSEVNPVHAIEAKIAGFELVELGKVAATTDLLIAATGGQKAAQVSASTLRKLKCGAVIINVSPTGHRVLPIEELKQGRQCAKLRHGVEHVSGKSGWFVVVVSGGLPIPSACRDNSVSGSIKLASIVIALIEVLTSPADKYGQNVYSFPPACNDLVCKAHLGWS